MIQKTLFFTVCLLCTFSTNAQRIQQLDSLVNAHVEKGFRGNIMCSQGDSIFFKRTVGFAEIESKKVLTDSSLFELGSVSKQFTAIAVITLVEANKLKYDTPIQEIIPDFPYATMTIEHLLQHRTGLPEVFSFSVRHKVWKSNGIATNDDILQALIKHKPKLIFQPGTAHEYSNFGYIILASVIEKVAAESFSEYLKKHVFQPAGMLTSDVILRMYDPREIRNNTIGYTNSKHLKRATEKRRLYFSLKDRSFLYSKIYKHFNGVYGDGGISSSLLEMELWKQAFRYNKVISAESKMRFTDILIESGKLGYGFWVLKSGEEICYYHPGQWAGYTSETFYYSDLNLYIVILSNNNYQKTDAILSEFISILEKK